MADEPLQVDAKAEPDSQLELEARDVLASYNYSQASRTTLDLVRFYVDHIARESDPGFLTDDYRQAFGSGILTNLGITNDPTIERAVRSQLDALAAGRAAAGTSPPNGGVHTAGDPIEMFTGQCVWEAVDASLRGAGIDLAFRRVYRHQSLFFGPLGYRWDHNYNLRLRLVGIDIVRTSGALRDDTYHQHPKFGQAGFNYWVPPDGHHAIIVEAPAGFIWRAPDGLTIRYEPDPNTPGSFRARRTETRTGHFLDFEYDDELLSRIVVNHPDRFLTLSYDEENRVRELRDHVGRRWRYIYDDRGDLVAATGPATARYPDGLTSRYEYYNDSSRPELQHNLLRVFDPAGRCYLENEYGDVPAVVSFNRVVRQQEGTGEHLFEYERVIGAFDRVYNALEQPAIQVNHVDRNGTRVHRVYNTVGNLLLEERVVTLEAGPKILQHRFRYNRDGAVVASISPLGRATQHYYGRDDFLRRQGLNADDEVRDHDALTDRERQAFANRLTTVRRSTFVDVFAARAARGDWSDLLADIFTVQPSDIVVKQTFDADTQLPLTLSDPRFTDSPNPRFAEGPAYDRHLTRYEYGPLPQRLLRRIVLPDTTFPRALPDGTTGLTALVHEYLTYDARGRLTRERLPGGSETTYEYVAPGPLSGPRAGQLFRMTRDANGLALSTTYALNDAGVITGVTNPRQMLTRHIVNELDQIEEVISAGPQYHTRMLYDPCGLVERRERDRLDSSGQPLDDGLTVETFQYDVENRVRVQTIGSGDLASHYVTTRCYNTAGELEQLTTPRATITRYVYDERFLPIRTVRAVRTPVESTRLVRYDEDGMVLARVDGEGAVSRLVRDALGRELRSIDPLGHVQQIEYDKRDALVVQRRFERLAAGGYALIERLEREYDEQGRSIRDIAFVFRDPIPTADPEGDPDAEFAAALAANLADRAETLTFYDRDGQVFRTEDPLGRAMTIEFDAVQRITAQRDPEGHYISRTYDENGNLSRVDRHELVRDPLTGAVAREDVFSSLQEFDDLDRRKRLMDGLGNVIRYDYDSEGRVEIVTDPLGNVRRSGFDVWGRKVRDTIEMTDTGLGGGTRLADIVTRYRFDENGNLRSIVDARGTETTFDFDPLDRRSRTIYADGSIEQSSYDREDRPLRFTRQDGLVMVTTRDAAGRTRRVDLDLSALPAGSYPAEAPRFESFDYDGLGRMRRHQNDVCDVRLDIDSLGRQVAERTTYPAGAGSPGTLAIGRVYDLAGNRTRLVYPGGRAIAYDYDALNRLSAVRNVSLGAGYPGTAGLPAAHDIARFTYRGARLARTDHGNGSACAFEYDAAARVFALDHQSSTGTSLLEIQHLYDAVGHRRQIREVPATAPSPNGARFRFDSAGRLTRIERLALSTVAASDVAPPAAPLPEASLLMQEDIDVLLGSLADDPATFTFKYDGVGNRVEERPAGQAPVIYTPDTLNQYQQRAGQAFTYDAQGNLRTDGTREWIYDYRSQLVAVRDIATGTVVLRLGHDALGRLVRLMDGATDRALVVDGVNIIAEHDVTGPIRQYVNGDRIDYRLQAASGGSEAWVHTDETGSTRLLTDAQGLLLAGSRCTYDPFGALLTGPGPSFPYLFCGKRWLDGVGVYDSRARHYQPVLGRFLQRDPAGRRDDLNLYTYAGNNPVSFVDPLGTDKKGAGTAAQNAAGAHVKMTPLQAEFVRVTEEYKQAREGASTTAELARVNKEFEAKLKALRSQANWQGNIEGWKFAGFAYTVATVGALGAELGAGIGLVYAEAWGLGTTGTFVLTGGTAGFFSSLSTESALVLFGKKDISLSSLAIGTGLGIFGGLVGSWLHYRSFPTGSMDVQGMPGLAAEGKYGWQFVVKESAGEIGAPIGAKIDPDIPVAPGLHRAHLRGYFIGGDNAAIYTTPRVNTSWMKTYENAADRLFQGGFLQSMGVRGGGRTALNWSAYDANGQAMHLGIADVLDESLPRLAPLLKANNVKVGPGTTIWGGGD